MPKKNADMNQFDWLKRMVCPGGRRDGVRMLFCLFVCLSQRHSAADHRSGTYNFRTQLLEETNWNQKWNKIMGRKPCFSLSSKISNVELSMFPTGEDNHLRSNKRSPTRKFYLTTNNHCIASHARHGVRDTDRRESVILRPWTRLLAAWHEQLRCITDSARPHRPAPLGPAAPWDCDFVCTNSLRLMFTSLHRNSKILCPWRKHSGLLSFVAP